MKTLGLTNSFRFWLPCHFKFSINVLLTITLRFALIHYSFLICFVHPSWIYNFKYTRWSVKGGHRQCIRNKRSYGNVKKYPSKIRYEKFPKKIQVSFILLPIVSLSHLLFSTMLLSLCFLSRLVARLDFCNWVLVMIEKNSQLFPRILSYKTSFFQCRCNQPAWYALVVKA